MASEKPRPTRLRSSLFAGIVIVAVAIGGYAGWHYRWSDNPSAMALAAVAIPVAIATAQQRDVPIYLTGLGTVQAFNTVTAVDDYAENVLVEHLSQISGVGLINIGGQQKPSVRIQLDPAKLASLSLSLEDLRTSPRHCHQRHGQRNDQWASSRVQDLR